MDPHHVYMRLSQLGEFGLIRKLAALSKSSKDIVLGIGDDTAAIITSKDKLLLLTCDSVIEGIHFDSSASPYQIGWKAMARNLSDIAAMGGIPRYALVAASFPRKTRVSKAMSIHRGLLAAAHLFNTVIVGGDTSHSKKDIHITVTVVGEVSRSELVRRSGARVGDFLCVTGTLGGSILGKHLSFHPRIPEARFLAQKFRPSAMMDISDGLASDLQRLANQSKVGFEIWSDSIPISDTLQKKKISDRQRIRHALQDGEDYELLFTLSPTRFQALQNMWKKHFTLELTQIGIVRPKAFGIKMSKNSRKQAPFEKLLPKNDHFCK